MKIFTSVLCLLIGSATCMTIEETPTKIVDSPPPPTEPLYPSPPYKREKKCNLFVPCFTFPNKPICCLPVNGCGGPYTFANSCYLGLYNCEHKSNVYYQYRAGECP